MPDSRKRLTPREIVAISKALDAKQVSAARGKLDENRTYQGSVTVTVDYSLAVGEGYTQERLSKGVDPWAIIHVLQEKLKEVQPNHSTRRTINNAQRVAAKAPKDVKQTRNDFQSAMTRENLTVNVSAPAKCSAELTKV